MLAKIFEDMSGWSGRSEANIIDNSNLTITETVSEIERILYSA